MKRKFKMYTIIAYVELLLHASSLYTTFNGTSTGDSTSDKESDQNITLEQKRLESNDTNDVAWIVIGDG